MNKLVYFLFGALFASAVIVLVIKSRPSVDYKKAHKDRAFSDLSLLMTHVVLCIDEGRDLHEGEEFIDDLLEANLISKKIKDPWGNGYRLKRVNYILSSAGPDRVFGTSDDLSVSSSYPWESGSGTLYNGVRPAELLYMKASRSAVQENKSEDKISTEDNQ